MLDWRLNCTIKITYHYSLVMMNSNDYQQLTRYWNLTKPYFNETLFHDRMNNECYADGWKLGTCFGRIYKDFRPYSTLWQHNGANSTAKFGYSRNEPDCKYVFEDIVHDSEKMNIMAHITSQCKILLAEQDSLGGSSFDVFSESKDELSSCSVKDHFNGNYTMTCPSSSSCINITAYVNYEHFDGVADKKIMPIIYGIFPPSTFICATGFPNILKILNKNISIDDNDEKGIVHVNNLNMLFMNPGVWRRSNSTSNETRWKYDWIYRNQKERIVFSNLESYLKKQEIKIHFIGSSHMRENYDLLLESLRLDRVKANTSNINNLSSYSGLNWGLNYSTPVLAMLQRVFLVDLCSFYERAEERDQKRVIVLQNGAWDLFEASLRVSVQDPKAGLSLINTIADIIFGNLKCGNIYRFIYITPAPHTLCNRDGHYRCEYKRGYRTNPNFATLRDFYVNNLHTAISQRIKNQNNSLSLRTQPQLHIVDAFNILRPRLIYSDESYNTNHFLCNCQNFFYETPGGTEVVNGIVFAISGNDLVTNITKPYRTYDPLYQPPGKCNCLN